MGNSRDRGPKGRSGEVQDLNDLTMSRGLSSRPGPVGVGIADSDVSDVDRLLQRLRSASSVEELRRIAVAFLGPQCFSAGVIAGFGVDVFSSATDLIKLVGTFVLADLHDRRTSEFSWWRYVGPTMAPHLLTAELVGVIFADDLRQAAEERDAIVKELANALQDLKALYEGLADGLSEGYKKDWQEFKAHMRAGTLEGRFRGGKIFGELLVDVLGLLTGVAGVAKVGATVATKLPRLVKYARLAKLKPVIRRNPRGGGSRGGAADVPPKPAQPSRPSPEAPTTTSPAPKKGTASDSPVAPMEGARVASGMTGEILPASTVRAISKGEKVDDLTRELVQSTYESGGLEHAIISLKGGSRVIVRGGSGGIRFGDDLKRVLIHTHPTTTGPSAADFQMLEQLRQRHSYIYELFGGGLSRFGR